MLKDEAAACARVQPDSLQDQLTGYFSSLIELRRERPGGDLVSALIAAEEHGDRLTAEEVNATLRLLFVAGYETSVNLIGNGMLALLQHPDQLQRLREDPVLAAPAVDEALRYHPPFQNTRQIALEDIDLGDYRIPVGSTILVWIAAANHDPGYIDGPERFDITRAPGRHLAFGTGIHTCLGQPLARLQAEIAFGTLARRLAQPRLESEAPHFSETDFRSLTELPVTFTPPG